jgi:hypothetical protein
MQFSFSRIPSGVFADVFHEIQQIRLKICRRDSTSLACSLALGIPLLHLPARLLRHRRPLWPHPLMTFWKPSWASLSTNLATRTCTTLTTSFRLERQIVTEEQKSRCFQSMSIPTRAAGPLKKFEKFDQCCCQFLAQLAR